MFLVITGRGTSYGKFQFHIPLRFLKVPFQLARPQDVVIEIYAGNPVNGKANSTAKPESAGAAAESAESASISEPGAKPLK